MKEITDRRYPIGKFEHGKNYSIDDTRKQIKTIARLPKDLKKILKKLRDGALDKSYRAGGWTARQVIHHLADSHMNAYVRFKLAATENAPIIKPYEETLWAETEDAKHGSAKVSLKLLSALHDRWVDFMMSLTADELDRGYYHPASKRTVSLREAIALYAWHAKHHLAHIKMVADGNVEKIAKKDKPVSDTKQQKIALENAIAGTKNTASGSTSTTNTEPKKRGRKPGVKPASTASKQVTAVSTPSPENGRRTRRTKEEMAAVNVAKAALPKLSRAEVMEKARAARTASAKPAVAKAKTTEPAKRGRKPNPEVAAAKAAKAALPKLSRAEVMEKARAARTASAKPAAAKAKTTTEPAKRGRKPNPEVAAAKAAKAALPKLSRAEVMEKARAARTASAKPAAAKVKTTEPAKRGRKPNPEIAAAKAAKAAAPKLSRTEVMEKARAAAAANRAAKAATAPKKAAPAKSTRVRRSPEEIAAEKLAKANQPKLSRTEVMEKARAAAAANRAAKGLPAKPKKDPNAPKLTREQALAKAREAKKK